MIARLQGELLEVQADHVIVNVGGVGFRLFVSQATQRQLPAGGAEVFLHVFTHVREDALLLYGFASALEKETFLLLTGVRGVGPRLALAVLSGLSPGDLAQAVIERDFKALTQIPGVGKKTAERLFFELSDKMQIEDALDTLPGAVAMPGQGAVQDAVDALAALGYSKNEAEQAVARVLANGQCGDDDAEALLRFSLGHLAKPS